MTDSERAKKLQEAYGVAAEDCRRFLLRMEEWKTWTFAEATAPFARFAHHFAAAFVAMRDLEEACLALHQEPPAADDDSGD